MVFSSISFLFYFLPLTLLFYYTAVRFGGIRARNTVLFLASLFFYLWSSGPYIALLVFSIGLNFGLALFAARPNIRGHRGKFILLTIVLNGALLGWFKYANFVTDQYNFLAPDLGLDTIELEKIFLPVGISFFTFQAISYVVDVLRQVSRPLGNPRDFGLYLSLFPQLVAGPIVRYHVIEKQIQKRRVDWRRVSQGSVRFVYGLSKKTLLADPMGLVADHIFQNPGAWNGLTTWLGILAYTLQIYLDFSAYSDMAIGLGSLFGFRIPENFRRPYSAVSITDFWRRWHITLSFWFRDYIYIPLGGSRHGSYRTYLNLILVFILTGFWHGANWTFLMWGLFHGAWLIVERSSGWRRGIPLPLPGKSRLLFQRAFTFFLVVLGWVLFRSDSLPLALDYWSGMFGLLDRAAGFSGELEQLLTHRVWLVFVFGHLLLFLPGNFVMGRFLEFSRQPVANYLRWGLFAIALPVTLFQVGSQSYIPFLYFQF